MTIPNGRGRAETGHDLRPVRGSFSVEGPGLAWLGRTKPLIEHVRVQALEVGNAAASSPERRRQPDGAWPLGLHGRRRPGGEGVLSFPPARAKMVSAWPAPGSPPNTPDTASTERGQGLETDSHRLTQPVVSLHRSPRRHRILIRHRIEQGYLAAMAGVARDSVSCTFREWHRQKVVQESSRTCSVVHKAKLEDAAGILARAERQTPRDTY